MCVCVREREREKSIIGLLQNLRVSRLPGHPDASASVLHGVSEVSLYVCLSVCVCVSERERDRDRERGRERERDREREEHHRPAAEPACVQTAWPP